MRFWESAEVSGNGREFIKDFVRIVEQKINDELLKIELTSDFQEWEWNFIAIIMQDVEFMENGIDKYYKEIVKKYTKKREMEFRLRIAYSELEKSNRNDRIKLYFSALKRCVDLIIEKKWGVSNEDILQLYKILDKVEKAMLQIA